MKGAEWLNEKSDFVKWQPESTGQYDAGLPGMRWSLGQAPGSVMQDGEGLKTVRRFSENIAYLLQALPWRRAKGR